MLDFSSKPLCKTARTRRAGGNTDTKTEPPRFVLLAYYEDNRRTIIQDAGLQINLSESLENQKVFLKHAGFGEPIRTMFRKIHFCEWFF